MGGGGDCLAQKGAQLGGAKTGQVCSPPLVPTAPANTPPPSLYEVPTYSTKAEAAPRAPGGARHGGRNGYLVKLSTKRGKTE